MDKLYIEIYGKRVLIESDSKDVLEKLRKDFYSFLTDVFVDNIFIKVEAFLKKRPIKSIPKILATRQSLNSITYDVEKVRFNDYHGEALSIFDYDKEEATIYSESLSRLHEITYLLILSRVGKSHDLEGLHKIHALGIGYEDKLAVVMMPMKGGKSTLLASLLCHKGVSFLSDDTPVIDESGRMHGFPLRIGIEEVPDKLKVKEPEENIYSIERKLYGVKKLLCVSGIENKIVLSSEKKEQFLFVGKRINSKECKIVKVGKLFMFKELIIHMIIGIGLPIIFEYFWEKGFTDFLRKSLIFCKRVKSAIRLLFVSRCYQIHLGQNRQVNAGKLLEFLGNDP